MKSLAGLVLLMAIGIVLLAANSSRATTTYQVPSNIPHNCSNDVTQRLLSWIASVPDNSILSFGTNACYRIEGTLDLSNRTGLDFEGNGSTFRSFNSLNPATDSHRSIWRFQTSSGIVVKNMTIWGSYAYGGTIDETLQWAHGIELDGTNAEIASVTIKNVAGDGVYYGEGFYSPYPGSSGSFHDSTVTSIGRSVVSVMSGNNITVQRVTSSVIGFDVYDIEPDLARETTGNVTFDSNTVGSYHLYAFSVLGTNAQISDVAFTNNRLVGQGLRLWVGRPTYRPQRITITGNTSDTAAQWPMTLEGVDGLTVTGNVVPTSNNTPMASVDTSCAVNISGNSFPGASMQAQITPWICGLTPTSGAAGTAVTITGSGFTGTSSVKFNGVAAPFTVNSDSQIAATVPTGATSGPISVTTSLGTATSSTTFTVTTQVSANFETGVNGNTIATSDAGSANAWDVVTIASGALTYDNTHVHGGTLAAKIDQAAGGVWMGWSTAFGTQTDHYGRFYLYLTALPAVEIVLAAVNVPVFAGEVVLTAAGKIGVIDANSSETAGATSVTLNQWVRVEYHWFHDPTAGIIEAKLFNSPESTTPSETITRSGVNTATNAQRIILGSAAPATYTFWMDDIVAGASTWPGPA